MAKQLNNKTKNIIRNLKDPGGKCKTCGDSPVSCKPVMGVDKASGPDESVEVAPMPKAEFDKLKKRQVFCVWCGKTIAYDDGKTTAERYQDIIDSIKRHDMQCEKNPLKKLVDAYRKKDKYRGSGAVEYTKAVDEVAKLEKDFENV